MANLFFFVVGAIIAVLVARHYHFRATNKSIGLYRIQASELFAGIAPDVRAELRFTYQHHEVDDLTQLEFVVGNDGHRAISNLIEPLELDLPLAATILDASILYRFPENLNVEILIGRDSSPQRNSVTFDFPLLNKGEFFLVKLLISGRFEPKQYQFRLVADDLPRSLPLKWLPTSAMRKRKYRPQWGSIVFGLVCLAIAAWTVWLYRLMMLGYPEHFPYPWESYQFSLTSIGILAPGIIFVAAMGLVGIGGVFMGIFEDMTKTGPKFPIPKEILSRHYRVPFFVQSLELEDYLNDEATPDLSKKPTK